ncbi:hypothetical protein P171DRAFT_60569 [Karstenula rhodostoma CBS 690.94]|uniref:Uncharacterized protein n=1 Tax=Karstenula rhodostoma CBS 690.94 TaxID=1392251 RepID=A0A9P4PDL5_9PLEO|nr:hypothetical protein P171DRAFT_60569 [Karstenula rhodostoma CBS 690.94]
MSWGDSNPHASANSPPCPRWYHVGAWPDVKVVGASRCPPQAKHQLLSLRRRGNRKAAPTRKNAYTSGAAPLERPLILRADGCIGPPFTTAPTRTYSPSSVRPTYRLPYGSVSTARWTRSPAPPPEPRQPLRRRLTGALIQSSASRTAQQCAASDTCNYELCALSLLLFSPLNCC